MQCRKYMCMLRRALSRGTSTLMLSTAGSLLVEDLGSTLEATGAAGSNETNLLAWRRVPPHGGGVTDMLVVTTTVGMLYRVHGHTTDLQHTQNSLLTTRLAPCTSFPSTLGQEWMKHSPTCSQKRRDEEIVFDQTIK